MTEHYQSFTNSIVLPAKAAGKRVRLRLTGFYQSKGSIMYCSLGNDGAFLASYIKQNAPLVSLGLISSIPGITMLLFVFFAPLSSKFKRSLVYYSIASTLFAILQMQEGLQLTVLFGHYHL